MKAMYAAVGLLTFALMGGMSTCDQTNQTIVIQDWLLDNGTLAVTCNVKKAPGQIRSISVQVNSSRIAILQHTNSISRDYGSRNKPYDVTGQLDSGVSSSAPFLKIQVKYLVCYPIDYECAVTFDNYDTHRLKKQIVACDGHANLKLEKSDFLDPAHFTLTCNINPSVRITEPVELEAGCRILDGEIFCRRTTPSGAAAVTSLPVLTTPDDPAQGGKDSSGSAVPGVIAMQIRRITKIYRYYPHNQYKSVTVARTSSSFSNGNVFLHKRYAGQGMTVSGSINQSDPRQSFLKIESGNCGHAGDYVCIYKADRGGTERFSVARQTVSDACADSRSPKLWQSISKRSGIFYTEADPTTFSLGCQVIERGRSDKQTVSLELSVLDDHSLTRKRIAFYNSLTRNTTGRLAEKYKTRGFEIKTSNIETSLIVNTQAGICNDAGLYRCSVLYWDLETLTPHVAIAEKRMAACYPGAVAKRKVHRKDKRLAFSFKCSANATLATKLLSLEISRLHNHSRQLLAAAVSHVDKGRPRKMSSGLFRVKGFVDAVNVAGSFISVITVVPSEAMSRVVHRVTSCKAVLLSSEHEKVVEAMSDGRLEYMMA